MKNKQNNRSVRPMACALISLSSSTLSQAVYAQADHPVLLEVNVVAQNDVNLQGKRTVVTTDSTGLPAAVSVVTAEELGTINIGRDISNMFRRVPGVVANNIDQGDTGNGFRMRGFATQGTHGADTAVYVDGVPQNMPSSQAGAGHGPAFLEWLTPDMIGQIDVIKGPVSALYGDQNRAGAVPISTQAGEVPSGIGIALDRYEGKRASLVLSGSYAFRPESPPIQSLFVADIYRTHSYRYDGSTDRDNVFWKLSTRIGDGVYSLRLNHYRSESTAAGYLLLSDLQSGKVDPRSTQYGLPGFGSGKRSMFALNRAPANGQDGWYATLYGETFERERGIATSSVQHTVGSDDRNIFGGRLANNFTFGDRAALMVGAEVRRDRGDAQRQVWVRGVPTANYINAQRLDLLTYGLFVQGQFKPVDTVKLTGGLRRDWFDYDIVNRKLPAASTDYYAGVTTPKIGAVWSVLPRLDLFANVAQGFRSPAAEQISSSGPVGPLGAPGGTIYDVSPSKVKSYDVGFTATPATDLTLTAAAYYTLNQDEIVAQPDGSYKSVGDTTRKGYEMEARWRPLRAVALYASYGHIIQAEANNPLPNTGARLSVPRHQVKLGAEYRQRLQGAQLTVNADAYLTSGFPYYMGTPQTQLRFMPAYTRFDLRAVLDWKQYQLSLFAVLQPHRFSTEAAYGSSAGLLVSPQPKWQFGMAARYFF
ncbi:TonB-dependent receptor [Cupriavidus necator]